MPQKALALLLALITGLDYLDNSFFSFFAFYLMGGLHATPNELVWSTTAYATASVLGILQQSFWVEKIGYRYYLCISLFIYILAGIGISLANYNIQLLIGRMIQGYSIGPMMGAARILIQINFTGQARINSTRLFLIAILISTAIAPCLGSVILDYFSWRALFIFLSIIGVICLFFSLFLIENSGQKERDDLHIWPYLIFALALAALQITMQQVRFENIHGTIEYYVLILFGSLGIIWFIYQQWYAKFPILHMHALKERFFQVSLIIFIFYYYISTAFSYLLPRLLEQGLGYPIQNAGYLISITALFSCFFYILFIFLNKRITHKKIFVLVGFLIAALTSYILSKINPQISNKQLILPLLLRGSLIFMIVLPVSQFAFRMFHSDDFIHSYRFKNILRQLTISFAFSSIIAFEQYRYAFHLEHINQLSSIYNQKWNDILITVKHLYSQSGFYPSDAYHMTLHTLASMLKHDAAFLAFLDCFYLITILSLIASFFSIFQKQVN